MSPRQFYIYVMTNRQHHVLYIGVTTDLRSRVAQHKAGSYPGVPTKYQLEKLIYYEAWETADAVVDRAKQLRHWHRAWKLNLIKELNHDLRDLSGDLD